MVVLGLFPYWFPGGSVGVMSPLPCRQWLGRAASYAILGWVFTIFVSASALELFPNPETPGSFPDQDSYAVCVSRGIEPDVERIITPGFARFLQAP